MKDSKTEKAVKWLYKYSDDLANFWGGILVLSIGSVVFLICIISRDQWNWTIAGIIAFILAVAFVSYKLMMLFARKALIIKKTNDEKQYEGSDYVISEWSLKTLETAGVGKDIVEFLDALREKEKTLPKELKMKNPNEALGWFARLEKEIGAVRVKEFRETILRYTRRAAKPIDQN